LSLGVSVNGEREARRGDEQRKPITDWELYPLSKPMRNSLEDPG
jgi:hypothetical protein